MRRARPGRRGPRQGQAHHDRRPGRGRARRSGATPVRAAGAGPAVGGRLHLRVDLVGLGLRRLRRRRLRPPDPGLAAGTTMTTQLVLDAVEQAIWTRARDGRRTWPGWSHHHDHGSQYMSLAYTERLAAAGIKPSVGAVGSSFDNALAETINGLYKTELIKTTRPWRSVDHVEIATAEWVDWFNHRRLYEYCGDIPPAEDGSRSLRSPPEPSRPLSSQTSKSPDTPGRFSPRRCPGWVGGGADVGSRWSARSAARTNDLDADGGCHRILAVGRTRVKALQFKPCRASACTEGSHRGGKGRASAQPYLGPRTRVRRHDDGWGARRAGCQRVRPLILSGASTQTAGGDRGPCGSWPRASADLWAGHAHNAFRRPPPSLRGPASPGRHRRAHAGCDSCGAGFCAAPPASGSCRYPGRAASRR